MMTNNLLKSCIEDIHRLQWNFKCGDIEAKRSYHAVKWNTITICKHEGGMSLRKLDQMYKVCGMKLVWKLISGEKDLWCMVMKNKYKVTNILD